MSVVGRDNISQLTCGIRFEKSFRISDITGQIFDTVLHDQSTPFGTEFFPKYQEVHLQDRLLLNDDRGYYLRIMTSDIIFQYTLHENGPDQREQIDWFTKDAVQFIIEKVLHDNKIQNIMRFGFMITHIVEGENLGGNVLDQLTSGEIKNADQLTIRFGNKDVTADGITKSGVNDYVNRITTIKQVDEKKYEIILDYQYYFLPVIKDLKQWKTVSFFERAFQSLDKKFYSIINPFVDKMAVAA